MAKNKTTSKHPQWALKHKRKGTELRLINGTYYLYEVSSKWNPEKKRPQKITGKLLGKITPEGFVESPKYALSKKNKINSVSVKEYGATKFLSDLTSDIIDELKNEFPENYRHLIAMTFLKLLHQTPLKNMDFYFSNSYLSINHKDITLGEKKVSKVLKEIGSKREQISKFLNMCSPKSSTDSILIDATQLFSYSQNIEIAQIGYNNKKKFEPQINILFIYSSNLKKPLYYRIVPGNIREVKAFSLTLKESLIEDAVIITDKGFYSDKNIKLFEENGLRYIIPLRRNNKLIDYSKIQQLNKSGFERYFRHNGRFIWYYSYVVDSNRRIHVYYDENLKSKEEYDYLERIEEELEGYTIEKFRKKYNRFGTLSIMTNNIEESSEEIYKKYKSRNEIEVMIGAMKNTLDLDSSYMRSAESFEGWMFLSFLSLQIYYRIYKLLLEKGLLKKYSVNDILMHLKEIKKTKINDKWYTAEINLKTEKLLKKLEINIT